MDNTDAICESCPGRTTLISAFSELIASPCAPTVELSASSTLSALCRRSNMTVLFGAVSGTCHHPDGADVGAAVGDDEHVERKYSDSTSATALTPSSWIFSTWPLVYSNRTVMTGDGQPVAVPMTALSR